MSRNGKLLRKAIDLIHDGKREEAKPLLWAILRDDKRNELAWKWYIESLTKLDEKRDAYNQWLEADPGSRVARMGLQRFTNAFYPTTPAPEEGDGRVPPNPLLKPINLASMMMLIIFVATFVLSGNQSDILLPSEEKSNFIEDRKPNASHSDAETEALKIELDTNKAMVEKLESENAELSEEIEEINERLEIAIEEIETLSLREEVQQLPPQQAEPPGNTPQDDEGDAIIFENNLVPGSTTSNDILNINLRRHNNQFWQIAIPSEYLKDSHALAAKNVHYNELMEVQTTENMTGRIMKYQPFVQADYYRSEMARLYRQNSGFMDHMTDIWCFVNQLDLDSREIEHTPKYATETLFDGHGDLEDKAILLATLLEASPVEWEVDFWFMDYESPQNKHAPNYIMVRVRYLGQDYYIDPAGPEMIPHENVDGWISMLNN